MASLRAARLRARMSTGAPRRTASTRSAGPGVRRASDAAGPEWNSFVARCLRSWFAAGASAGEFLATWTPLGLAEPLRPEPARPDRALRQPSTTRRRAHRTGQHPTDASTVAAPLVPATLTASAAALRARYPLVSALLVELAATPGRRATPPRRQQRS